MSKQQLVLIPRELGNTIVYQRQDNGYINATALSKAHQQATGTRREVSEWLSNKRTIESIQHLSKVTGIPVSNLIIVRKGKPAHLQGTYIHPKLSIRFAIWLSDEFGYIVEEWVEEWLLTGKNPIHADDLERINLRRQLKDQDRLYLTDQLKAYLEKRGEYSPVNPHHLFSQIHDAINRVITGETSKQMYQRTGLKSHQLLRDYFPLDKLNHYSALTICIANYILDGHEPIEAVHLAANQALPRYFKAEPIEMVDPIKVLEQQLLERLLPPKKH